MKDSIKIIEFAKKSLLLELSVSPKPGLVDRFNNGSHNDMDFFTFIDSIFALAPYFDEYFLLGFNHEKSPELLFSKIREMGKLAEKSMLDATKGINTHKGTNFSFAILVSACGVMLKKGKSLPFSEKDTEELFDYVSQISKALLVQDFSNIRDKIELSYGEKLYLDYGITGIRGEASNGYPNLV